MKKNILIPFAIGIIIILVTDACKKDPLVIGPELSFMVDTGFLSSDTTMAVGDTAVIGLVCKWDGTDNIASIHTYFNQNLLGDPYPVPQASGEEFIFYTKITKNVLSRENWEFQVLDVKGHKSILSLEIKLDTLGGPIDSYQPVIGAQGNESLGSFYKLTSPPQRFGDNLSGVSNPELVELLGGFDIDAKTFLASPSSNNLYSAYDLSGWATRNKTLFCKTTYKPENFDLFIDDHVLISSFYEEDAVEVLPNIQPGEIYSFKTESGKYGLIKIISITTSVTGHISFDYKIQQ
jgi:hypothetical protein